MEYIAKNYSLNKTYFIDKKAIISIIEKILNNANDVVIDTYKVHIDTTNNTFGIKISLWTKKIEYTTKIIKSLTKIIDAKCYSSFNIKPHNILINIKGVK